MRIKSFFAASVEAALEEARRELGPEAMLIQSRPAPADARALGEYEVVCALLPADVAQQTSSRAAEDSRSQGPAKRTPEFDRLASELEALRSTVGQLHFHMMRNSGAGEGARVPAEFESLRAVLLDAGVEPELARMWTEDAPGGSPVTAAMAGQLVRERIAASIRVSTFPAGGPDKPLTIALVGPPGAGKTACVAKIAARYGAACKRSMEIVLLDEHRIAPSEPLRTYAAILGARFHFLNHGDELHPILERPDRGDLVLIDTPGFSMAEETACHNLARALGERTSVETHLVLPASLRSHDLRRISELYEPFNARVLIFTRLDETRTFGAIANEAVRTQRAVSFLAAGPRIPENLEPATGERIAELILASHPTPHRAAAAAT